VGSVRAAVRVERPVADVFPFAADQRNRGRLLPDNFSRVRVLSEHSVGVGARLAFTIETDRGSYDSVSEITAYDPPDTFAERGSDGTTSYETVWRFAAEGSGTRVSMAMSYPDSPRWTERLLDRLAGRRMLRHSLLVELTRLKLAMEAP
jgi:hypothetical protein